MEQFGLLAFLRALLENPPSLNENPTPPTTPQTDGSKTEAESVSPPSQEQNTPSSQDAVLHFLSAHEARSNRSKKRN